MFSRAEAVFNLKDMKLETYKEDDVVLFISFDNWETQKTVVLYNGKLKTKIKLSLWDKIKIFFTNHYS